MGWSTGFYLQMQRSLLVLTACGVPSHTVPGLVNRIWWKQRYVTSETTINSTALSLSLITCSRGSSDAGGPCAAKPSLCSSEQLGKQILKTTSGLQMAVAWLDGNLTGNPEPVPPS